MLGTMSTPLISLWCHLSKVPRTMLPQSIPLVSALSVASPGCPGLSLWFHLSRVSRTFPLVSALSVSSLGSPEPRAPLQCLL